MKNMLHFRMIVAALLFSTLLIALSIPQSVGAKTTRLQGEQAIANCFAVTNIPGQAIPGVSGVAVLGSIRCFGIAQQVNVQVSLLGDGSLLNADRNGGFNTSIASASTSSRALCGTGIEHKYTSVVSGSWQDDNGFHVVTPIEGPPAFLTC